MDAAKAKLDELGELQLSFGLRVQQAKTAVTNFVDSLSLAVATSPVVAAGMDSILTSIQGAFGGSQQETVKKLMGYVNDFAIFLVDAARVGGTFATLRTVAFIGPKWVFNAFLAVIFEGLAKANSALADLAEKGAELPVVGKGFEAIAKGARGVADLNASLAYGFKEQAKAAIDASTESVAAFTAVEKVLDDARKAMVGAEGAQTKVNEAIRNGAAAMDEAVPRAQEYTQKILEAKRKLEEELSLIGLSGRERRLREMEIGHQREIEGLKNLKEITAEELAELTALAEERYRKEREAATATSAEILEATRRLEEEVALAKTTGLEEQLLRIEQEREAALASLATQEEEYGASYARTVALTNEKFDQMRTAATGYYDDITKQASEAGFKTREELEASARQAVDTYQRMLASGKYTEEELGRASELAEEAKRKARGETCDAWMAGTQQVLGMLGERNKAAAIAGAIIATYQAIAKALASAPWPFNLALAAGAAAAGWANVNRIRAAKPGYAIGTPGTRFEDFGRESIHALHGREAIVTPSQAESVGAVISSMVATAISNGMQALAAQTTAANQEVVMQIDGEVLGRAVIRRNRAGLLSIREASIRRYG